MMEYDFDRQHPIHNYIVDFYCKDIGLAIEVDGMTHDDDLAAANDEIRQKSLTDMGIYVLRFSGLQVVRDMPNVMRAIEHWLMDYEDRFGVPERVLKRRKCR